MDKKYFIKKEEELIRVTEELPLINQIITDTIDRLPGDIAERNTGDYVTEIYLPKDDIDNIRLEVNMMITLNDNLDLYFENKTKAFSIRILN